MRVRVAVAAGLMLAGCTAETVRTDECALLEPQEQEDCVREARDPKWDIEEERREREDDARTPAEKRRIECEALKEPELTQCLLRNPEPDSE